MIPKPQNFDSMLGQKWIACLIMLLRSSVVVTAAVKFDGQLRRRAIEIEDVNIDRMLPPEFISGKISIPQPSPKDALRVRRIFAEATRGAQDVI